jgi:ferredoxin-NADP reductase
LTWLVATVTALRDETPSARTLTLHVPGWRGHLAGQHVDVKLTAPDGYSAVRSYSIATEPRAEEIEITVERLADGEVSSYLAGPIAVGDMFEIRGPLGGWFVWRPEQHEAVQLIAGGSGMVPLMAMIRAHADAKSDAPFRALYSVRNPESVLYKAELEQRAASPGGPMLTFAYTRAVPAGWARPAGRVDAQLLADVTWPASATPTCYVCGPTEFVEHVADLLASAGHDSARIRTERFGPSGVSA